MMQIDDLVFVTSNVNKVREAEAVLGCAADNLLYRHQVVVIVVIQGQKKLRVANKNLNRVLLSSINDSSHFA